MLIPLADHLFFITAPKGARFPYAHSIFVDDEVKALFDTTCGQENLTFIKKKQIDMVINTHFHEDHILHNHFFPEARVLAHSLDAPAIRSLDVFCAYYGFDQFGCQELGIEFIESINLSPSPVHQEIIDGEILDFGKTRLQVIHTPGHTPGHCSFYHEPSRVLFSSDIDLSRFGPWYGHLCSDPGDFVTSIEKCLELDPAVVVSSHKGIITEDIPKRFNEYRDVILNKEALVLESLQVPSTLEELAARQIFYGNRIKLDPLMTFYEKMAVYLHLRRLLSLGLIQVSGATYFIH